jgi:pimeloyl-ACP methyl ester carboxylesterase
MVRQRLLRFAMAGALLGSACAAPALADDLQEAVTRLGGKTCEDSSLTCVEITVPTDHAKPDSNHTLKIRFAISFASEDSQGILFYAVGGPGGSGTALAETYLNSFDERVLKQMDVVFFDQRGTGQLNGVDCPKAGLAFDSGTMSLQAADKAVADAKSFVTACLDELSHRDLIPYLSTDQAIQDLEAFRQQIGAPKVWLYGESYGTQFAQQYATRYPSALQGLVLDGVVDLTRDAQAYYSNDVTSVEKLLTRMMKACDSEARCSRDMGAPAEKVYDQLAAKLDAAPVNVDFPLAAGGFAKRPMTATLLETDAFYALYGPDSRMSFLRALAAAAHDQWLPLLRLGYQNIGADPQTLGPDGDRTWYGAAYYAITCPDYDDAGHDPAARTQDILKQANELAPQAPRAIRDFYAERLVCAFWPTKGVAARPAPFAGGNYPTLVLNSDSDPATPIANGYAVFDHARNAYMVTMEGGPHVIWGRDLACPDKIVSGLMLDGRKPERREQICRQDFVDAYVPLTAVDRGTGAFQLGRAIETELDQSPELSSWDGNDPLAVGCDFGGTVTATAAEAGTEYAFKDCAWWPGLKLNGDGVSIDADDGSKPDGLTLTLNLGGDHGGAIVYRHDTTTDAMSVSGTFDGKLVTPPRPMP